MPVGDNGPRSVPPLFAAFDAVRVINLIKRKDRRAEMQEQLAKVGLLGSSKVQFFPAVTCDHPGLFMSAGAHGCFLSHIEIIQQASAQNQSVLILEDDCDFSPEIWDCPVPCDVDIFYGGYLEANPEDIYGGDIVGSHMMGFSVLGAQVAAEYFSRYIQQNFEGDARARSMVTYNPNIRPPIDGGYVWLRRAHPELRTGFSLVSSQRPSRSDITPSRFLDKIPIARDIVELMRRRRRV